ncbi:MAG TPA: glycosyltransferase family 4 protein [Steroidobacteraceae bacterium]|nr:glycosyltransferase family 4 protein [Steroidobacteraceae bacterium]
MNAVPATAFDTVRNSAAHSTYSPVDDIGNAMQPRLRCLWISRDIPFPQDAGDRIYSGNLAAALTRANAEVCFMGYAQSGFTPPSDWVSEWRIVDGNKRDQRLSLLSLYPRIAAMHATPSYYRLLEQQLQQPWDAIVLDGYACGWALPLCLKARSTLHRHSKAPVIIYVSHNHEASLWRDMFRALPVTSPRRLAVWQNYLKIRQMEQSLIKHADLVTTITQEDAQTYAMHRRKFNHREPIVLTPGYVGHRKTQRQITHSTPRHVLVMGSFRWVIKQENLRRLIAAADPVFAQHGMVLDIVGDVPPELLRELRAQVSATVFHGFVEDVSSLVDNARIALVPDVVGGGFKLKFLDYVFSRLPIAAITACTSGLPADLLRYVIACNDMETLVRSTVNRIDDIEMLNLLQNEAYRIATPLFDWNTRGQQLATAIRQLDHTVNRHA